MKNEMHIKGNTIQPGDITQYLLKDGADMQLAILVTGMTIGYLSSGVLNHNGLERIIEVIDTEKQS